MTRAVWNDAVIAESDDVIEVDGYTYFPDKAVNWEFVSESSHRSRCYWKGTASYYTIEVDGEVNENAAWTYPDPLAEAEMVRGRIGFWRGVRIER